MGVDEIGGGAPAVESTDNPIDLDSMSSADLDEIVSSGGIVPERLRTPAAPVVVDPPADEEKPVEEEKPVVDEPAAPAAPEEPKAEEEPEEAPEAEVEFTFTENADPETRAKERKAYLAQFELPQPMQEIYDELLAENEELKTAQVPESDTDAKLLTAAFDQLIEIKRDANDIPVPDTEGVRALFQREYPNEYRQLIKDVNTEDSAKYPGYTRMQEFIRDGFGLNEEAMSTLDLFLNHGGKMPVPNFVPDGVKPEVAEAYWRAFDRDDIDTQLRQATFTLNDEGASDEERMQANLSISKLNTKLAQIQNGLNYEKNKVDDAQRSRVETQQKIVNAGVQGYVDTTLKLLGNTRAELEGSLTNIFEGAAGAMTASGLSQLLENALSDADEYSKAAQETFAKMGIKADWAEGKASLEKLWQIEQKIAALDHLVEKKQVNPRALVLAKKQKVGVLLEIRGHEKNLIGKITKALATGSGKALEKKLAEVPKLKQVRPRVSGNPKPFSNTPDFDRMSKEELDSYIGQKKYLEAQQGAASS
jgi:hypothetical protein